MMQKLQNKVVLHIKHHNEWS